MSDSKVCSRCKIPLPLTAFVKGSKNPDGLQRWCNGCRNSRRAEIAGRITVTEKRCKDCRKVLPVALFHRSNIMRDGYQSRCYTCHKLKYGIGTPENNAHKNRIRIENWERATVRVCKIRAGKLGVPFSLVASDIVIPEVCPVLGIPLVLSLKTKTPNTPSIDRVIPALGYVPSNIRVISWRANRLKLDETDPEVFERIAQYIRANR